MDWALGTINFKISGPTGDDILVSEGVHKLSLDRNLPWGPSASINNLKVDRQPTDGLVIVKLEMQSGDVIELQCERFT
jgi:hypothetical protein